MPQYYCSAYPFHKRWRATHLVYVDKVQELLTIKADKSSQLTLLSIEE